MIRHKDTIHVNWSQPGSATLLFLSPMAEKRTDHIKHIHILTLSSFDF